MLGFAIKRVVNMLLAMFAVSVLVFLVFNVIPAGDPEDRIAGKQANEITRKQVRKDFGFDEPLHVQYGLMMTKMANGSLESYKDRVNVREEIVRGIPATASLVIGAAVIWLVAGVGLGVYSALRAGRLPDRLITMIGIVGISLPVFWVGAVLLYYLTYKVSWFPPGGYAPLTEGPWEWLKHLVLPWAALSILFIGFYSRLMRSNTLETMNEDFVRTARAKGLPERRVISRHVMRNALIPIITLFGLDFGAALGGGAILTESVFGLEGVGQYAADSVGDLDLPPVMGITLYGAFFIVLLSAVVDLVYARLDPRIRLNG